MKVEFPFEYAGGGYFRRKGVKQGQPAECLHGMEAINYILKQIETNSTQQPEPPTPVETKE